ncbi:SusC/RagA family TonB-linked outer membrane protein [Algoriphagus sp. Y33]|uniref:SusC/RagA family TonB-linked outer membrane protein n=1 Tax=Algoriphagus sp. Y33 TaxID=2772483 RepID=UPI00177DE2A5|nr:SusC/RagA family TonB-linked outer membrane protein [Algoriphagus sp. Y33]
MNLKLQRTIYMLSKYFLYGIFIQMIFISLVTAGEVNAQLKSIDEVSIDLGSKEMTLKHFISTVEKLTDFNFSYDKRHVDRNEVYRFSSSQNTIEDHLREIVYQSNLSFKQVNHNIDISQSPSKTQQQVVISEAVIITGKVTDSEGEPIPGVVVSIQGISSGTVTDIDGNYSIEVAEGATLVFSFIGYETTTVTVGNQTVIDVQLDENLLALEEVVVIGYGTQKKGDVTGSVASVKAEDFVRAPVKDVGQLIQGKVAGLTIGSTSGDPTSGVQVSLRGNTTILGASSSPLILIDGIPGDFRTVAPEDIESIDVLKDGSAAAIYGVRGNNGVILITTKGFDKNQINSVEYSVQMSTDQVYRQLDMLTAADYRKQIADGTRDASWDNGSDTDWFKEGTRSPFSQIHNLTYRGGKAQTSYLINLNYRDMEGIMLKSDNKTFSGRVDIKHKMLNDKLVFNIGILGRQNSFTTTGDNTSFSGWTYRQMTIQNPTSPIKTEDGRWFQEGIFDYENPLSRLYESDGRKRSQFTRYNSTIEYMPLEGLSLKAMFAYDKFNDARGYSETKNHISNIRDGRNGYASIGNRDASNKYSELTANYSKVFGGHEFSVLGGYGYQENEWFDMSMSNFDFPTDQVGYADIGAGKALADGLASQSSSRGKTNLISFFGRVNYTYKDKYLLLASVRREAASQLYGAEKPWGTFPALSLGWRIHEEGFMDNISVVNNLKLRAGYGVTGNAPADLFLGVATLGFSDYYLVNGAWVRSLVPTRNPNPYLKWEEKKEFNVGVDFELFNNRVYGTVDYYVRRIDGLLYDYQVPSPPNIYPSTRANVGMMENKGLEVSLSIEPVKTKNVNWTTQLLYSTNTNKLVSLSNDLYKLETNYFPTGHTGVPIQTHTHLVEIGGEIGNFHGYNVADISDDGYWIYENSVGEEVAYGDFNRSFDEKQIIGNGIPDFHAGWNNTVHYKNFDFGVTMRGSFKFQIINFQRMYYENPGDERYNRLKSAYEPVFGKTILNENVPLEYNDYYVEDGDFVKIDNITLGYNVNQLKSKHIHSIRFHVSTLNTFIITKYKGIDPEVNWNGLSPGIDDRDKYPTTRTFTIGASIKF